MLWASRLRPVTSALRIRVYGETGGLEWAEDPNYLWHTPFGEPKRLITRNGAGSVGPALEWADSWQHPEGYLEEFANIYSEAAAIIAARARATSKA